MWRVKVNRTVVTPRPQESSNSTFFIMTRICVSQLYNQCRVISSKNHYIALISIISELFTVWSVYSWRFSLFLSPRKRKKLSTRRFKGKGDAGAPKKNESAVSIHFFLAISFFYRHFISRNEYTLQCIWYAHIFAIMYRYTSRYSLYTIHSNVNCKYCSQ